MISSTLGLAEAARRNWDAVVIGAGPAGTGIALALRRRRFRVLIIERSPFPRDKVCGGCLNGAALEALQQLGLRGLPAARDAQPIRWLHLAANGSIARIKLPYGVSLSRATLDAALLEECLHAGADALVGVRASLDIADAEGQTAVLHAGNEITLIQARIVVLAHGLYSGEVSHDSWLGAATVLGEIPPDLRPQEIKMAIGAGGYVGAVQVEGGRCQMAAALDPRLVKAAGSLGRAVGAIRQRAGLPEIDGLTERSWKGTPFLTRRPAAVAGPRWFAVGDAAGYVEPFTGEGMSWALQGALALAPIAARAARQWNNQAISEWTSAHARVVERRQRLCRYLRRILHSPRAAAWLVRGLRIMPGLARPFVPQVWSMAP